MRRFFSSPLRVAIFFILGLVLIHVLLTIGRLHLPGFAGELCGKIQGLSITPFVMEFFLVCFGFMAVFLVNHFRRKWEGEELVYLEVVNDPEAELPESSKSVIFSKRAEQEPALKTTLAAIEGAISLKDYTQAEELLSGLDKEEKETEEVKNLWKKIS